MRRVGAGRPKGSPNKKRIYRESTVESKNSQYSSNSKNSDQNEYRSKKFKPRIEKIKPSTPCIKNSRTRFFKDLRDFSSEEEDAYNYRKKVEPTMATRRTRAQAAAATP
jgi:hypothetical protein